MVVQTCLVSHPSSLMLLNQVSVSPGKPSAFSDLDDQQMCVSLSVTRVVLLFCCKDTQLHCTLTVLQSLSVFDDISTFQNQLLPKSLKMRGYPVFKRRHIEVTFLKMISMQGFERIKEATDIHFGEIQITGEHTEMKTKYTE